MRRQERLESMIECNDSGYEPVGEIVIYETDGGLGRVDVRLDGETAWLTQKQLASLFQTSQPNISMHLQNIFEEVELAENSVYKEFLLTAEDGKRYSTKHYNLDAAISLGYRINSKVATQFRIWATERLKEYIIKGFTMDDERLKSLGGGTYWRELLDRIRDIRSSEKVFYRQVLDLYATSIDYDPKAEESILFFKIVQNKLHFAAHGHTAAEVIFSRADAEKDFMGLTTFKGSLPTKGETEIAKNYLDEDELKRLNNLVSGYFDFAEMQAETRVHMTMADYIEHLEAILKANKNPLLLDAGSVSRTQAIGKAHEEYRKYQQKTLSDVEREYLETIKNIENTARAKKIGSTTES
jgi:hypothetical protein